ncbi:MAG: hypothetical protein ABIP29_00085, partial [Candidatus Eisenbacteria bacterium]
MRARTGPDSTGHLQVVTYDAPANRWSRPGSEPPRRTAGFARERPRLDQVLVFNGGLFDQFAPEDRIELGDGFVLAKSDT